MKLHAHPASTASRPVMMFCAHDRIKIDNVTVDLFSGEHMKEPFLGLNPNGLVPVLEDDGFVLSESSAILKYLADKTNSACYPKELKARARVNELMDWFNTQMYREIGYHLVYPQVFPAHKRMTDEMTQSIIDWGLDKTRGWLEILDKKILGHGKTYLTGDRITIADFFGAEIIACADLIRCDFSRYPNVTRWLGAMKALPHWTDVHQVIDGFAVSMKDKAFTAVA